MLRGRLASNAPSEAGARHARCSSVRAVLFSAGRQAAWEGVSKRCREGEGRRVGLWGTEAGRLLPPPEERLRTRAEHFRHPSWRPRATHPWRPPSACPFDRAAGCGTGAALARPGLPAHPPAGKVVQSCTSKGSAAWRGRWLRQGGGRAQHTHGDAAAGAAHLEARRATSAPLARRTMPCSRTSRF